MISRIVIIEPLRGFQTDCLRATGPLATASEQGSESDLTTFRCKIRLRLAAGTVTNFAPSENQQVTRYLGAKLADCPKPPLSDWVKVT